MGIQKHYFKIESMSRLEDVVHIYSGILLSQKRNKIVTFVETWMDLETDTERSKRNRRDELESYISQSK